MLSAICFNLDRSKILLSDNELRVKEKKKLLVCQKKKPVLSSQYEFWL